jgi:hypothetical protein
MRTTDEQRKEIDNREQIIPRSIYTRKVFILQDFLEFCPACTGCTCMSDLILKSMVLRTSLYKTQLRIVCVGEGFRFTPFLDSLAAGLCWPHDCHLKSKKGINVDASPT